MTVDEDRPTSPAADREEQLWASGNACFAQKHRSIASNLSENKRNGATAQLPKAPATDSGWTVVAKKSAPAGKEKDSKRNGSRRSCKTDKTDGGSGSSSRARRGDRRKKSGERDPSTVLGGGRGTKKEKVDKARRSAKKIWGA